MSLALGGKDLTTPPGRHHTGQLWEFGRGGGHENRWAQMPGSVMKQPVETHPNHVQPQAKELYVSS